jgi:cyclopropane-fatty-acyl-phospholipid synthase
VNRRDRIARAIVTRLLEHVRGGALDLVDPLGYARFGDHDRVREASTPVIEASVDVHDARVYERLLREGSVGLGESYADGWWDAGDLAGVLRLALRSLRPRSERRDALHRFATPLLDSVARLRRADPGRDARQVRAHYDLGNEFFRQVLDETMAYSCAIFDAPDTTLADASIAKFDRLAHALDLSPGDRVLEIGTGWGGFALHAAERYGCRVTTTTVSRAQYEFATERVRTAGLDDRITVLDRDYRELHGTFDKAVAIEMIEAVDWRDYDAFFASMRRLLTDDGTLAMQAIVVPDASFDRLKRNTDFIKAAIFPGGCLPSIGALSMAAHRNGLALRDVDHIGRHYGETLRRWRANLHGMKTTLPALGLDDRFGRLWDFYFAYCEAGFDEEYIGTTQLRYSAPDLAPVPTGGHTRSRRDAIAV